MYFGPWPVAYPAPSLFNPPSECKLLQLPDELLFDILSYLADDLKTLRNIALLSRRFASISRPFRLRRVAIFEKSLPLVSSLLSLGRELEADRFCSLSIRKLHIKWERESNNVFGEVGRILTLLVNLEDFWVNGILAPVRGEDALGIDWFTQHPMSRLRRVSINLRSCPVNMLSHLINLPNIVYLCFNIMHLVDGFVLSSNRPTELETLNLGHSELDSGILEKILRRTPKLRSLRWQSPEILTRDHFLTIRSLPPQLSSLADSLQYLDLTTFRNSNANHEALVDLRKFSNLRDISIPCKALFGAGDHRHNRRQNPSNRLPPNLESLMVRTHVLLDCNYLHMLVNPYLRVRNLSDKSLGRIRSSKPFGGSLIRKFTVRGGYHIWVPVLTIGLGW